MFGIAATSVGGILLIVLFLIIQKPERAEKLKALIFEPTYKLFKWGARQYLASKISTITTDFFNRHIISLIPSLADIKIKIKWVRSVEDPILKEEGIIIVRMRETNDQTLNYLSAAHVAFPQIVCKNVRFNMQKYAESALDLALLKKFSDKVGKHSYPIFQKHFLRPTIENDPNVSKLFKQLVEIDSKGTFVSIFLEELNILGEVLYSNGDTNDCTEEIIGLLIYLVKEARRQIGEHIELEHITGVFKLAIVLVAKREKAEMQGVTPYINSIDINLKKGCDSIYIIAYPTAFDFLKRLLDVIESDNRLTILQRNKVQIETSYLKHSSKHSQIILLRRNKVYDVSTFEDQISSLKIKKNDILEGNVIDVSETSTLVNILGVNGIINLRDSDWRTVFDCREIYKLGDSMEFFVKDIDRVRSILVLSRKFPDKNPLNSLDLPRIGSDVPVKIIYSMNNSLICLFANKIEMIIPNHEVSWTEVTDQDIEEILGKDVKVKVTAIDKKANVVLCSLRKIVSDPWPQIHKRFPKGKRLNGKIFEITPDYVRVSLLDGFIGMIPRQYLQEAGFEYSNFKDNLVIGQGIEVVISKVFIERHKIRLNLARNIKGSP